MAIVSEKAITTKKYTELPEYQKKYEMDTVNQPHRQ